MAIVTVGIDLARNDFAVHGVEETGKPALMRLEVPRAKLLELIANLAPCLIGMEACSGAHRCAHEFARVSHPKLPFGLVEAKNGREHLSKPRAWGLLSQALTLGLTGVIPTGLFNICILLRH